MQWNFRGGSLPLGGQTYLMGILNITPDSFSDGGKYVDPACALQHALEMERQGAHLLDIGAQSTRPGHKEVSAQEEWRRLEPVLTALRGKTSLPVSIDTYYPEVAAKALRAGAQIINDVSGVVHPGMADVVRSYEAGWVIMHTGGGDADHTGVYETDIVREVRAFFEKSMEEAEVLGIPRDRLCMDMGIGFGKTYAQNLRLLGHVRELRLPGIALLTGTSRKRVIGQATGVEHPSQRVYGNVSAHTAAIAGGTDILRVHEVGPCLEGAKMADAIYRGEAQQNG